MALTRQYEREQESLDYRTAVIASQILNTIPRTKQTKNKVFTPGDIFPHYGWQNKKYPTQKELWQKTKAIFSMFSGDKKVEKNG